MPCVSDFSGLSTASVIFSSWTPSPVSHQQAVEAIKAGVDALPDGVKMFLNSGKFYDKNWGTGKLKLLSRFFANHPALCRENLSLYWKAFGVVQDELGSIKMLDLFEPARIDPKLPVETTMKNLMTLLKEGKFSHIGLSECNANTLRKAHSIYPVTAAEIELNISVLAYSPLGQGFLTGQIKSPADIPERVRSYPGDMHVKYDQFKEENFNKNLAIVNRLKAIVMEKKVDCLSLTMIPLIGSSKASRTLENLKAGEIQLKQEEQKAVEEVISVDPVAGKRYFGAAVQMYLWG
ncbi:aldo/keto reductase [Lentinula detonsa]|uniref:Aldo/keto reductase n=1 Tax=Lentinula detonsa TaxID=2804962 RepID=A0AA38UVR7_9AGAR|nr:aldo/keto reductase [Lentinula detonsa]